MSAAKGKWLPSIAVGALLVGCGRSEALDGGAYGVPPRAYVRLIDKIIAYTGIGLPGRPYACVTSTKGYPDIVTIRDCVKLQPAQRWRGIWETDRHGGSFCPSLSRECDDNDLLLLEWPEALPERFKKELPEVGSFEGENSRYSMDFVGRRTAFDGMYGPGGNQQLNAVTIDRMISLQKIPEGAAKGK